MRVVGVGRDSVQGDIAFADLLQAMGARIERGADWIEARAGDGVRAVDWDCTSIPDAAMTAAVVALFAPGRTTLRGIGSWRVKETDRIAAMATELGRLGARIEAGSDRITDERDKPSLWAMYPARLPGLLCTAWAIISTRCLPVFRAIVRLLFCDLSSLYRKRVAGSATTGLSS